MGSPHALQEVAALEGQSGYSEYPTGFHTKTKSSHRLDRSSSQRTLSHNHRHRHRHTHTHTHADRAGHKHTTKQRALVRHIPRVAAHIAAEIAAQIAAQGHRPSPEWTTMSTSFTHSHMLNRCDRRSQYAPSMCVLELHYARRASTHTHKHTHTRTQAHTHAHTHRPRYRDRHRHRHTHTMLEVGVPLRAQHSTSIRAHLRDVGARG